MKKVILKYAYLFIVSVLMLIPLKLRAKVLWAMFSFKNKLKALKRFNEAR